MLGIINMAGQEGLEPPTPGFGVRRSTIRATGLQSHGRQEDIALSRGLAAQRDVAFIWFPCEVYAFDKTGNTY